MSMDREKLATFLESLADRYYGYEIVGMLEDAGVITVEQVIAALEEFIIEGKNEFEV